MRISWKKPLPAADGDGPADDCTAQGGNSRGGFLEKRKKPSTAPSAGRVDFWPSDEFGGSMHSVSRDQQGKEDLWPFDEFGEKKVPPPVFADHRRKLEVWPSDEFGAQQVPPVFRDKEVQEMQKATKRVTFAGASSHDSSSTSSSTLGYLDVTSNHQPEAEPVMTAELVDEEQAQRQRWQDDATAHARQQLHLEAVQPEEVQARDSNNKLSRRKWAFYLMGGAVVAVIIFVVVISLAGAGIIGSRDEPFREVPATTASPAPTIPSGVPTSTSSPAPTIPSGVPTSTSSPAPTIPSGVPTSTSSPAPTVPTQTPTPTPVPDNGSCEYALAVESSGSVYEGDLMGASEDEVILSYTWRLRGFGRWYTFQGNGLEMTVLFEGDTEEPIVLAGKCGAYRDAVNRETIWDDTNLPTFSTTENVQYWIFIHVSSHSGNFVTEGSSPDATLAESRPYSFRLITQAHCEAAPVLSPETIAEVRAPLSLGASPSDNMTLCPSASSPDAPGIWYRILPEEDDRAVRLSTEESPNVDTQISVFQGNSCAELECVVYNDDADVNTGYSAVEFVAQGNETYSVFVQGRSSEVLGTFILDIFILPDLR